MTAQKKRKQRHAALARVVFSNLKAWINGTHHGRVKPHHLQAYLNEYVFRFNRRVRLPVQPALLADGDIQLDVRTDRARDRPDLRRALLGRVGAPPEVRRRVSSVTPRSTASIGKSERQPHPVARRGCGPQGSRASVVLFAFAVKKPKRIFSTNQRKRLLKIVELLREVPNTLPAENRKLRAGDHPRQIHGSGASLVLSSIGMRRKLEKLVRFCFQLFTGIN